MHLASHRILRRATIYGALVSLLCIAAVTLTQCTMVKDDVTGVSLEMAKNKPDKCIKECKKDFDKATRDEFKLNSKNRKKCNNDPVCLALETERHLESLQAIEDEYANCLDGCHHQGGGGGR